MNDKFKDLLNVLQEFTLNGNIQVSFNVMDNSDAMSQSEINRLYTVQNFNEFRGMVKKRKMNYYGKTDLWLYRALAKYPIQNKSILLIGSTAPWYEAIAIEFGASKCDVVEYSSRKSMNSRVRYFTPDSLPPYEYDAIISISSFEHDGLGRYGDPIDADGDLKAIDKCRRYLAPGGLLFLSVPVGYDQVVLNAHRIYGKIRLPLLLSDWEIKMTAGGSLFTRYFYRNSNTKYGTPYQPVYVLKDLK